MMIALRAKFKQHKDLQERLLATYPRELVEDSPMDSYWGVGKNGDGRNRLGRLLEQLREELRVSENPT